MRIIQKQNKEENEMDHDFSSFLPIPPSSFKIKEHQICLLPWGWYKIRPIFFFLVKMIKNRRNTKEKKMTQNICIFSHKTGRKQQQNCVQMKYILNLFFTSLLEVCTKFLWSDSAVPVGLKTQTYQSIKACKIKPYMALCVFWIFPAGISSFSLHMYVLQYIEKEIIFSFGITGKSIITIAWVGLQKPSKSHREAW